MNSKFIPIFSIVVLALFYLPTRANAATIQVPANQSTIQTAINVAADGDEIVVSPGTYYENLMITKKIKLRALYQATEAQTSQLSIINGSGDNCVVLSATGDPAPQVSGFNIINCGDSVSFEGSYGVISNNIISTSRDDGIDVDGPSPAVIENNQILSSRDDGIEIRLHAFNNPAAKVMIRNNLISASGEDGIQLIEESDAEHNRQITIDRNLIINTKMSAENYEAASLIELIYIFNNTLVNNNYGITGGDNLIALNNIITGTSNIALKNVDANSIASYNLLWNNLADNQGSNLGNGNLYVNPLLDSNQNLMSNSPAIDKGIASFSWQGKTVLSLTSAGYNGSAPDIGRFESSSSSPTPTLSGGCQYDYDSNHTIGLNDLLYLLNHWNNSVIALTGLLANWGLSC